jgi:hypothetical protein
MFACTAALLMADLTQLAHDLSAGTDLPSIAVRTALALVAGALAGCLLQRLIPR